jgi:DNA-directed RNA polymerase beta' subunit
MGSDSSAPGRESWGVRLGLAGPDDVLAWSSGEVVLPATCQPRSGRPVPGGLFCERIFGPVQDYRCACGRLDGARHEGRTCQDCGAAVLHRRARRRRMGHIELAAPVAHVWFFKARPSPLAALLGLRPGEAEQVVYGRAHLVLLPGTTPLRAGQFLSPDDLDRARARHGDAFEAGTGAEAVQRLLRGLDLGALAGALRADLAGAAGQRRRGLLQRLRIVEALRSSGAPPERLVLQRLPVVPPALRPMVRLASGKFASSELNELYRRVLRRNNRLRRLLEGDAPDCILSQEKRLLQQAVDALFDNQRAPRPVRGRHGRLARSLSDLIGGKHGRFRANLLGKRVDYSARSVIVVGPELKLHQCGLPRAIALRLYEPLLVRRLIRHGHARTVRKGRGLLHELAHPALLARTARLVVGALGRSLAVEHAEKVFDAEPCGGAEEADRPRALRNARDVLKELGSPAARRRTAHALAELGPGPVVRQARAVLQEQGPAAARRWVLGRLRARQAGLWALVEDTTRGHPVLLNRAPTLHRMGVQAFEPVLVEGHAIRLHPLVCKAFNADFDGDQMAVHLPLSIEARVEARVLLLATNNLFNPANGQPLISPSQDIVMGCHYLTLSPDKEAEEGPPSEEGGLDELSGRRAPPPPVQFTPPCTDQGGGVFAGAEEVVLAHALGKLGTHARVTLRLPPGQEVIEADEDEPRAPGPDRRVRTTAGRVLFNELLPAGMPFYNLALTARRLARILTDCRGRLGPAATVVLADRLKVAGFEAATRSGLSFATDDVPRPAGKAEALGVAGHAVEALRSAYRAGNLGAEDYALRLLELWSAAHKRITARLLPDLRHDRRGGRPYLNPLSVQIESQARGSEDQLRQLAGMRGLMASASGRLIERSITASLREGLPSWDYFLSAHGARKGLTDKGVRTAEAGYLTRKLIDAVQGVVVRAHDCGTHRAVAKRAPRAGQPGEPALRSLVRGRVSRDTIEGPGGVVVRAGELIGPEQARALERLGLPEVWVRGPLTCELERGVCRLCYGADLATGRLVEEGLAVGVVAAQSIGEPGTQLTMHTFRLGGVAGKDIVNDLERVTRLLGAAPALPGEASAAALLEAEGPEAAQDLLLGEVRRIYRRHGLEIDDRHFEVVLARLLGFVRVVDAGDTALLPEQVLERRAFRAHNDRALAAGRRPATCRPHFQGLARAAAGAEGFLAAASFQRAVAVLTESALEGRFDALEGLKENVILGRLIPAGTGLVGLSAARLRTEGA